MSKKSHINESYTQTDSHTHVYKLAYPRIRKTVINEFFYASQ